MRLVLQQGSEEKLKRKSDFYSPGFYHIYALKEQGDKLIGQK